MADTLGWRIIDGGFDDPEVTPGPLAFLRTLAERDRLGFITVDWEGCPACVGGSSIYIATLQKLPGRYCEMFPKVGIDYGSIHWRQSYDPDNPDGPPTFKNVVEQSYKAFLWMTAHKRQRYGGHRVVESFRDIPGFIRPKFPQLFFLDGFHIAVDRIDDLIKLHTAGDLFHPYEVLDEEYAIAGCYSGDLQFTKANVVDAVTGALADGLARDKSLLLQLTNFNMYSAAGDKNDDFMKELFLDSCDCVVSQFANRPENPANCIRFERSRDS